MSLATPAAKIRRRETLHYGHMKRPGEEGLLGQLALRPFLRAAYEAERFHGISHTTVSLNPLAKNQT